MSAVVVAHRIVPSKAASAFSSIDAHSTSSSSPHGSVTARRRLHRWASLPPITVPRAPSRNDVGIHREGAPALFEAGREPRWFSGGTEIADPMPKGGVWHGPEKGLVGGDFVDGEPIVETQKRIGEHLYRAIRTRLLTGEVSVKRRGVTLTFTAKSEDREMLQRILDSYNRIWPAAPGVRTTALNLKIVTA